MRTWAPRGKTPVLEFDFNWKQLSVIGGITVGNFYFQFYPGAIKSPQVIEFLKHLQRQLPGKLLVIWDGAMIHRRRLVREYLKASKGALMPPRFRLTRPNSIPPNMSGAISSSIGCPTSPPRTSPNAARLAAANCGTSAAAPSWSPLSGSKPNWGEKLTVLCRSQ